MANDHVTEEEMFAELRDYFDRPPDREPGWLDISQISKNIGVDRRRAKNKMDVLVESGTWESMEVMDTGSRKTVYRMLTT